MSRRVSRKGAKFVAGWESFLSCPYWDAYGQVWTRGYGNTIGITASSPCISERQARRELRRLLNKRFVFAIPRQNKLKQQELDALASFAYNLGTRAVGDPGFSTLARRLHSPEGQTFAKRKDIYREELPKWAVAGGQKLEGLVKRRHAEVRMACQGIYDSSH